MLFNALLSKLSIEVAPLSAVLGTPLREALTTLFGVELLEDIFGDVGFRFGVVTIWLESAAELAQAVPRFGIAPTCLAHARGERSPEGERIRDIIPESISKALDECFASGPSQPTSRVAADLSISSATLQRAERDGQIVCRRKGTTHRLFAREDVDAYTR